MATQDRVKQLRDDIQERITELESRKKFAVDEMDVEITKLKAELSEAKKYKKP